MSNNLNKYYKNGSSYEPRMQAVEQQVSQFIAGEVGKTVYFPTWYTPPHLLYIKPNGGLYSKTTYAALWAAVSSKAITPEEYDATVASSNIDACGRYADIDADTFRVPTVGTGGFMRSVGANGEMPIGSEDGGFDFQIENITGVVDSANYLFSNTDYDEGAFQTKRNEITSSIYYGATNNAVGLSDWGTGASFDASRVAKTGDETSPQGFYVQPYIFTGIVVSNLPEPTSADLAQIQTNTDAITSITSDLNKETFAILDVNGGADIGVNQRYEIDIASALGADWVGEELQVQAEVYNNTGSGVEGWGETGWIYAEGYGGLGVNAATLDGSIIIQTGDEAVLIGNPHHSGSPFGSLSTHRTSAPCRVKVWRSGHSISDAAGSSEGSSSVAGIGTSGLVEIWSGGDAEETIQCPEGWDTYTMLTLTATNGKYVHSNTYPISVLLANPDKYYVGMKHSATGTRGAYLTGFTATTCEMIWVIADGYTITHVHCIK